MILFIFYFGKSQCEHSSYCEIYLTRITRKPVRPRSRREDPAWPPGSAILTKLDQKLLFLCFLSFFVFWRTKFANLTWETFLIFFTCNRSCCSVCQRKSFFFILERFDDYLGWTKVVKRVFNWWKSFGVGRLSVIGF